MPIRRPAKTIYQYLNYREFLRDIYAEKQETEGLTLRQFAAAAGFNAHSFMANVLSGTRSLTLESAGKVSRALGLKPTERDFFDLLVRFEAARTADEKNDIYDRMRAHMPKDITARLSTELFDVLREPYIFTVRELVSLPGFREDPVYIAKKLNPQITPGEAKAAIALLLRTGLLKRNAQGKLIPENPDLTTGAEIRSLAACLYHQRLLEWAAAAIDGTPASLRDISSLTLNVSKSEFEFIKKRTAEFRGEILDFLKAKRAAEGGEVSDEGARALYYLNLQLFNATETPW